MLVAVGISPDAQVLQIVQDCIACHFLPRGSSRRVPGAPNDSALKSLKEGFDQLESSQRLSPALSERIVSSLEKVSQSSNASPLVSVELSPDKLSVFELCAISDIDHQVRAAATLFVSCFCALSCSVGSYSYSLRLQKWLHAVPVPPVRALSRQPVTRRTHAWNDTMQRSYRHA